MLRQPQGVWWRRFNGALIPGIVVLWVVATHYGWMQSLTFLSHVSLGALLLAAVAAWRADKPTPEDEG